MPGPDMPLSDVETPGKIAPPEPMKWYEYRVVFGIPGRQLEQDEIAALQKSTRESLDAAINEGTTVTVESADLERRYTLNRKARRDRARRKS